MALSDLQSFALEVAEETPLAPSMALTRGHILTNFGAVHAEQIRLTDVLVIRHAFKPGDPVHLHGSEDATCIFMGLRMRLASSWA